MKKVGKVKLPEKHGDLEAKKDIQGYPLYPDNEDIYKNYKEEKEIDPEDTSRTKELSIKVKVGARNEKDFDDDVSGNDLDVPGSELDDELEIIGSEDEENNYYSLGGDDHSDLDEEKS